MYVLKGEKSLSTETEIVFTVLLLLGGMKQAITNTRSVSRSNSKSLGRHSSLFSTTNTARASLTLKILDSDFYG